MIGNGTGSDGSTVTVTGSGSTWSNSGELYVGSFGDATLEILAGATVSSSGSVIGRHSTSSVTVSGSGSSWATGALLVGGDRSDSSSSDPAMEHWIFLPVRRSPARLPSSATA